ncbi:MAG: helix-turn-helix domain-containing protein [Deltaproteobacteria bacterium]|nr:helix-turn-helix domain-containing protein [Deltaproteobacteria bacterium]
MLSTHDILCRLREVREERRLKQDSVAKNIGVDRTTYIRKEQGVIPITTEEWLRLAKTMRHEPSYFFGGNGNSGIADSLEIKLLELYRTLENDEKADLISCIHLVLKGIKRKTTRDALKRLSRGKKK